MVFKLGRAAPSNVILYDEYSIQTLGTSTELSTRLQRIDYILHIDSGSDDILNSGDSVNNSKLLQSSTLF